MAEIMRDFFQCFTGPINVRVTGRLHILKIVTVTSFEPFTNG